MVTADPSRRAALLRRLLRAKDRMDAASHEQWPVRRLAETYKDKVKLTFMKGREIDDPDCLFNVRADGVRQAIDLRASDTLDAAALRALVRRAIAVNLAAKT